MLHCGCGWKGTELVPFFSNDTARCPSCTRTFKGIPAADARGPRPTDPPFLKERLGGRPAARQHDRIMEDYFSLAHQLSPENLYRDGEATKEEAARDEARLREKWGVLDFEIGRQVSEDEVWDWYRDRRGR